MKKTIWVLKAHFQMRDEYAKTFWFNLPTTKQLDDVGVHPSLIDGLLKLDETPIGATRWVLQEIAEGGII